MGPIFTCVSWAHANFSLPKFIFKFLHHTIYCFRSPYDFEMVCTASAVVQPSRVVLNQTVLHIHSIVRRWHFNRISIIDIIHTRVLRLYVRMKWIARRGFGETESNAAHKYMVSWVFLSHFTFALFTSGKLFTKICLFSVSAVRSFIVCMYNTSEYMSRRYRSLLYRTQIYWTYVMLCVFHFFFFFSSFRCCFHYSPHLYHTIFGASALVFSQQLRDYDSYPTDDDLKELASRCYNSFAICICHFIQSTINRFLSKLWVFRISNGIHISVLWLCLCPKAKTIPI